MAGSKALAKDVKREADAIVEKAYIEPLKKVAGKEVANMTVSVESGYEYTLSNLAQLTFDLVKDKIAMEASVVTAIAQRVSPSVTIDGCIAVCRMRYWNSLASITSQALEKHLDMIHSDIITVWSLDDPRRHLRSREFKGMITLLVDDLSQNIASDSRTSGSVGKMIMSTLLVYQNSHEALRRFMAYLVDLTLVMQNIFWLISIRRVPVSRRIVMLGFKAYKESIVMSDIHEEIKKHVEGQKVFGRSRRDSTLSKVIELLNGNRINTVEMFELKKDIGYVDFLGEDEESW